MGPCTLQNRIACSLVASLALGVSAVATPAQTVRVAQGTLAGASAAGISSFKGIPYAAPPVGDLRWRPPVPAKPWTGMRQARQFGSACMQPLRRDTLPWTREFMVQNDASEDCLFLNVWTPRVSVSANLPVLVFLHGGGFTEGSGGIDVYNGANLARKGLVVVTINYRLGVFGFLAHPALTAESPHRSSGNYGLEDCVEALRWVRANIRAFGGDASRVTVWGQSAGAFAVGALMGSPVAKGTFTGAVADSGLGQVNAVNQPLKDAEEDGVAYAASLVAGGPGAGSLAALRATPAADLVKTPLPRGMRFRPTIDGWFLTEAPSTAMEDGTGSDVPLMTGYQSEDSRSLSRPDGALMAYTQRLRNTYGSKADEVLRLYPAIGGDEGVQAASETMSHDRNRVNQWLLGTRRTVHSSAATYTYYMDQAIPWPQHPEFGAFHSGELPYMFSNLQTLDRPWTDRDREVSRILSGYLVNFAKTGSPDGAGLPHWPRVTVADKQTMELGLQFKPMPLAEPAREAFWETFLLSQDARTTPTF